MLRRILLLAMVAAVLAVMVSTAPAVFAQEPPQDFPGEAKGREEVGPPLPFGGDEPEIGKEKACLQQHA